NLGADAINLLSRATARGRAAGERAREIDDWDLCLHCFSMPGLERVGRTAMAVDTKANRPTTLARPWAGDEFPTWRLCCDPRQLRTICRAPSPAAIRSVAKPRWCLVNLNGGSHCRPFAMAIELPPWGATMRNRANPVHGVAR